MINAIFQVNFDLFGVRHLIANCTSFIIVNPKLLFVENQFSTLKILQNWLNEFFLGTHLWSRITLQIFLLTLANNYHVIFTLDENLLRWPH
jgi:hypothetical protein